MIANTPFSARSSKVCSSVPTVPACVCGGKDVASVATAAAEMGGTILGIWLLEVLAPETRTAQSSALRFFEACLRKF